MEFITQLWLPIVLTGVVLFFASFVAWTVLPHHQKDWGKVPDEPALLDAIRKMNIPAGNYMFPYCSHQDAKDPAMQEKYKIGPRGVMTLWDMPSMGRNMALTLVYFLLIALVTAYIATVALEGKQATFLSVFRIVGAIGVLVFASSGQLSAIWFPKKTFCDFIDGIVYGLIMGLIFATCASMFPG